MNYNLEIQKLLLETDKCSNFDDKLNFLKQAITIADANNDVDWGYDLRLHLIHVEQYTTRSYERFPAFVWILNVFDTNPDYFSETDIETILNEYQWMAFDIYRNVDISREQIMLVFADFKDRLQKHGYTDRAYNSVMVGWHLFIGEIDTARKYTIIRDKYQHDNLYYDSELIESVCIELVEGNFDKAIAMAHGQIVSKSDGYVSTIPMLCTLVYYLSKAGDERADKYFKQIEYEFSKQTDVYPFSLNTYALLMHHMALFDKEKAWRYFEQCSEWEIGARDLLCFEFSLNLLPLLKAESGQERVLNLSSKQPYYRTDNTYNVSDLYNYYLDRTLNFVGRFDVRNGNVHFKEQFDEVFDTI